MLDLNIEFIKGVLFIRVIGDLINKTKNKFEKDINDLLDYSGITNVVINLEQLNMIDDDGINALNDINNYLKQDNGNLIICNLEGKYKNNNLYYSSNELTALNTLCI